MDTKAGPVRKSLPLSARDVNDLRKLREDPAHTAALFRLVPYSEGGSASESSFLHAPLQAGFRAVQQEVEDIGYARMAAGTRAGRVS